MTTKLQEKVLFDESVFEKAKTSTELTTVTQKTISELSNRNSTDYKNITEKLLENQRILNAGELGQQINQLITTASEFDPAKLNRGFLGKIKAKVFGVKNQIFANSGSVQSKIDQIVTKIDDQLTLHNTRQQDIYELYEYNRKYHSDLLDNIATGEHIISILKEREEKLAAESSVQEDSFVAQDLKTLKNQIVRLQTTVDNFKNNLLLSKQTAAELEILKESGLDIFETVKSAKNSLIPIWKMALIKYIVAQEQGETIKFAQNLKDAHSEAIRRASDSVYDNAIKAAELATDTLISTDDLATLNDKLIGFGNKLNEMQSQYKAKSEEESKKREQIEKSLLNHLSGKDTNK